MRRILFALLVTALLSAREWVLIAHPASGTGEMDAKEIREVYLGKQRFHGALRLYPLQLAADDPLRKQFEAEILRMSRTALREWWIRRHYLGQRPPKVMGSPEAVAAYVEKVPGAVGYVPRSLAADANVTVLYSGGEGAQ